MRKFLLNMLGLLTAISGLAFAESPSLTYQISQLHRCQDKTVKFTALNFPKYMPLNLTVKRVDGKIIHLLKVNIDDNNRIIERNSDKEFIFTFLNCLEGEPFEYNFSSSTKKLDLTTTVIPRPLEAKDDTGHVLALILRSPLGEIYSVEASGFEPFEEVTCYSHSES